MSRVILFDAVGTLLYPDPPVAQAYATTGRLFGSQLEEIEISRRFRQALKASWASSKGDRSTCEEFERQRWRQVVTDVFDDVINQQEALFESLWNHFSLPAHWRLFGDVVSTWSELSARGYTLGIASNFDERLRGLLAGLPPLGNCRHLFISSHIGYSKPDPRFYSAVARQLELPANEILMVGDDYQNDVIGSRAAGMSAIWLRRGEASTSPATNTIGQLTEMLSLLD